METGAAAGGVESSGGSDGAVSQTDSSVDSSASAQGQNGEVVANQPTKSDLKELGQENMDAIVTMKVNGKVEKMTVRQALKQAELGQGAQQKMQQAAAIQREFNQMMHLLKNDPDKFFEVTGMDADGYAERRLIAKYEKMAMTPEQRRIMELEAYKSQKDKEEQESKKSFEQKQQEARENAARLEIEKEFIAAWKDSGLPNKPLFGQWMASFMHAAEVQKERGLRDSSLQASEAASMVKESFMSLVGEITGELPPEEVHRLLGESTMKKLREFDVRRVTGKSAPSFGQSNRPGNAPASGQKSSRNQVSEKGWNDLFRNIK